MSQYLPRIADGVAAENLQAVVAVLIDGPKAVGKTSAARQLAASEVLVDVDQSARRAAEIDLALVLQGARPRLLDEWHLFPLLWDTVRRQVDEARDSGDDGTQQPSAASNLDVHAYARLIVRGGWPAVVGATETHVCEYLGSYLAALVEADIPGIQGARNAETLLH